MNQFFGSWFILNTNKKIKIQWHRKNIRTDPAVVWLSSDWPVTLACLRLQSYLFVTFFLKLQPKPSLNDCWTGRIPHRVWKKVRLKNILKQKFLWWTCLKSCSLSPFTQPVSRMHRKTWRQQLKGQRQDANFLCDEWFVGICDVYAAKCRTAKEKRGRRELAGFLLGLVFSPKWIPTTTVDSLDLGMNADCTISPLRDRSQMLGACSGASCPEWEEFQRAFKITQFPLITAADVGPSSSDLGIRPQSQLLDWVYQEKKKPSQVTVNVTDQRHNGCV